MTSVRLRRVALLALSMVMFSVVADAAPPDTSACINAFDQGQRARTDRKLRRAQTELLVCTQESCPVVLRADCAGVLRNVQAALPTIVLAADDGEGHDITDVRVKVGNDVMSEKLDGRAFEFDPGTYDFRFERLESAASKAGASHGAPTVMTIHHVLREGEKNRVVRASFRAPGSTAVRTEPPPPREVMGYVVPASLVVLGLAGFTTSLISRLRFDSRVDDMRGRCAPDCTQTERADLSSTLATSNVSLAIGIGAIAVAGIAWFLFTPQAPMARTATTGLLVW